MIMKRHEKGRHDFSHFKRIKKKQQQTLIYIKFWRQASLFALFKFDTELFTLNASQLIQLEYSVNN